MDDNNCVNIYEDGVDLENDSYNDPHSVLNDIHDPLIFVSTRELIESIRKGDFAM